MSELFFSFYFVLFFLRCVEWMDKDRELCVRLCDLGQAMRF